MRKMQFLDNAISAQNNNVKSTARLLTTLEWIYRWRYTTPDIIKKVLEITNNHHYRCLNKWEKRGLIKRVPIPHPIIRNVFILTKRGCETLQAHSEYVTDRPLLDKTKIRQSSLQHTIAVQDCAASIITPGHYFSSEDEVRTKQQPGKKVPDFMTILADGNTVSVEVELSCKSPIQIEIAFSHALSMLLEGEADLLCYYSSSRAILKKYEQLLRKESIPIWIRNTDSGRWYQSPQKPHYLSEYADQIYLGYDQIERFKRFVG